MTHQEIGRELRAEEIRQGTVVVLHKEGSPFPHATADVVHTDSECAAFAMGRAILICFVDREGYLVDGTATRIHVWEWLGERTN